MLNKEKIRLMTGLAIYRKHNDEVFRLSDYYKSDFIIWQIILAEVRFLICFILVVATYIFFNSESFFYNVNLLGIQKTLFRFGYAFVIGGVLYGAITAAVCSYRYKNARKGILLYASGLKRLMSKSQGRRERKAT